MSTLLWAAYAVPRGVDCDVCCLLHHLCPCCVGLKIVTTVMYKVENSCFSSFAMSVSDILCRTFQLNFKLNAEEHMRVKHFTLTPHDSRCKCTSLSRGGYGS
mgnify:CR=1 FL=1